MWSKPELPLCADNKPNVFTSNPTKPTQLLSAWLTSMPEAFYSACPNSSNYAKQLRNKYKLCLTERRFRPPFQQLWNIHTHMMTNRISQTGDMPIHN